ncbi:MAG: TadE/TadG family type IV pilus assembly protein [Acidimicrobiia bacterium]
MTQASESNQQGASLVEFALILPILLSLLLGTVTAALSFSSSLSLNNAARETARFGATLPVDPDIGVWLNEVADVSISSATGDLDSGVPGRSVCIAYVHPAGTAPDDSTTMLTIDEDGARTATIGSTCFADGRPLDERRVQVRLERETDLNVLFFSNTITLTRDATVRFERAS